MSSSRGCRRAETRCRRRFWHALPMHPRTLPSRGKSAMDLLVRTVGISGTCAQCGSWNDGSLGSKLSASTTSIPSMITRAMIRRRTIHARRRPTSRTACAPGSRGSMMIECSLGRPGVPSFSLYPFTVLRVVVDDEYGCHELPRRAAGWAGAVPANGFRAAERALAPARCVITRALQSGAWETPAVAPLFHMRRSVELIMVGPRCPVLVDAAGCAGRAGRQCGARSAREKRACGFPGARPVGFKGGRALARCDGAIGAPVCARRGGALSFLAVRFWCHWCLPLDSIVSPWRPPFRVWADRPHLDEPTRAGGILLRPDCFVEIARFYRRTRRAALWFPRTARR